MTKKLTHPDAEFLGHMEPHRLKGPKLLTHIILFSTIIFIAIMLVWSNYAIIDENTVGEGKVIPSLQVQAIQNLEGGIVEKILVKEGQIVSQGQALVILDDTRYLAAYNETLIKQLNMEIKFLRLKAEVEQKPFVVPNDLAKKEPETVAFETSLYNSRQQELKQLNESYFLAIKELDMTKPLVNNGAASPVEVLRLERAAADVRAKVLEFNNAALEELNKTKTELGTLKESNQTNIDRIKRAIVRSPVRGIINQLTVHTEGGVVQPGSTLMEIVPLDDTLLIEAKIKPKDIGFLHIGQTANVTITAFDYAKYGSLKGKVEQISADSITDEKSPMKDTYYLIKVRTSQNYLGTKENPLYIIPGMQARIDIQTGKKSILEYILSPFINAFNNALRER